MVSIRYKGPDDNNVLYYLMKDVDNISMLAESY